MAVCRLMPRPPARVDRRKQKSFEVFELNAAIDCFLLYRVTFIRELFQAETGIYIVHFDHSPPLPPSLKLLATPFICI